MSEIKYKTGWIKDPEGNKFAPITTTDQVITSDGADLASEINNIKNDVTTLNSDFGDYTLGYPTDLFSASQCLCRKAGKVVHVYVSLKTGVTLTQGQTFKLTGHPVPLPWDQSMRIIDFNAASTYINVTNNDIQISVDRAFSPNAWIRFAFDYICS